jgi:DNA (cytosine-5)-methyltransferase 1
LNSRDPVLLVNPEKELYRRFTPREAARIQSFPDDFIFPVSDTQAYRQIGNAIPPVLMWHVMKSLSESIIRIEKPPLKSHTHLQFAPAITTPKIVKEYVSPTLNSELNIKYRQTKLNV